MLKTSKIVGQNESSSSSRVTGEPMTRLSPVFNPSEARGHSSATGWTTRVISI